MQRAAAIRMDGTTITALVAAVSAGIGAALKPTYEFLTGRRGSLQQQQDRWFEDMRRENMDLRREMLSLRADMTQLWQETLEKDRQILSLQDKVEDGRREREHLKVRVSELEQHNADLTAELHNWRMSDMRGQAQ